MALTASPNEGQQLPKGVAFNRPFFMGAGVTGLTLTVTISKAAAAFGAIAGAVTEISSGWYKLAFTSGDTDTQGSLAVHVTDGGTNIVDFCDQVAGYVTLADGVAHGGTVGSSTATLALDHVKVYAPTGFYAMEIIADGNGSDGLIIEGVSAAIGCIGTGVGADCIDLIAGGGNTLSLGGGSPAILAASTGAYPAVQLLSANGQPVIQLGDGTSGGECIRMLAGTNNTNNDAVHIAAAGTGHDINLAGSHEILGYIAGYASPTFVGNGVQVPSPSLDLTQAVATSNTANTIGDCLNAARSAGFGDRTLNPSTRHMKAFADDGTTVVHEWIVDSVPTPLQRIKAP